MPNPMNTPANQGAVSDKAIAQAFRDIAPGQFKSAKRFQEYILGRARLIDTRAREIEAAREMQVGGEVKPPIDWEKYNADMAEYVDGYEYIGETEDGADASYTPNERERLLILDAMLGWEAERSFAHPAAAAGEEHIRFDWETGDPNRPWDSKVITHDEMRQRYASMHRMAHEFGSLRANPLRADGVVTDEMVERACIAFLNDWPSFHQHEREQFRKDMRAALTAALRADADGGS